MSKKNTADQSFLRELNISTVLRNIHTNAPISRAQLAARTGLNKSTISSLVEELLEFRLIHETGINSIGTGRPSTMLEINPQAGCIIGVELGVDFVAAALTDFVGNVLWRRSVNADPSASPEMILDQTLDLVSNAATASLQTGLPLFGIGVATPGMVDLREGILIFAPNLHWHNIPLRKLFSERFHLRVFIENDANAAAVAEHLFGVARQCSDFIFVFAGVGIGGGLFLNGKLYRGKNGFAGEIGHSPIMTAGVQSPCHCGNLGCWETYANQYSIIQRTQARLEVRRASLIPGLMAQQNVPLSISIIKQAADAGDLEAIEAFADAGKAMGQGFATLINFFNPEKIILGGPLSLAGNYLLPAIQDAVIRHSLPVVNQKMEVVLSHFGTDASLIGAISIVVDEVLSHPYALKGGDAHRSKNGLFRAQAKLSEFK
jgi:glucokinase-like ROK family protein